MLAARRMMINAAVAMPTDFAFWWRADSLGASGSVVDNFNRSNSTTTINPRSDGGSWTVPGGTVGGINTNRGYIVSGGTSLAGAITADVGSASQDITFTDTRPSTSGGTAVLFGYDPLGPGGFYLFFDSGSFFQIQGVGGTSSVNVTGYTGWTGGSTTLRLTFDSTSGAVALYQNGSSTAFWTHTLTTDTPWGTHTGFFDLISGEYLDNFTAKPLGTLVDGDAVSAWVDSSGHSLNAAQSTSSLRPIFHSAPTGFGGEPAILFDGVDDMLTLPYTSIVNPSAMTLFAVIQPATLGTNIQILQSETASAGYSLKINSTPSGHVHFYLHNGGALNGTDCGVISTASTTHWACGTTTGSGTTALGYLDGVSSGAAAAGALSPNTTDATNIGTFDGYIAEIIGYGRVLTDPERGAVDSYIKAKYGL